MTEAENLLVEIEFVVDMYNALVYTADEALEEFFYLVDSYEEEVAE